MLLDGSWLSVLHTEDLRVLKHFQYMESDTFLLGRPVYVTAYSAKSMSCRKHLKIKKKI